MCKMAFSSSSSFHLLLLLMLLITVLNRAAATPPPPAPLAAPSQVDKACIDGGGGLEIGIYQNSCPEAEPIIFSWVQNAVSQDPRMAASLLRLHFHDCFVNGCDASVLLDDTPTFVGEKTAAPNLNSLRGFQVIDAIKSQIESVCPQTVSCADILAVAARDSVVLSGGPGWEVELGRKDGLTASKAAANNSIPGPNFDVTRLVTAFQNVGLTLNDMVALSGAHTMGKARCATFSARLNSNGNSNGSPSSPDMMVNVEFLQSLQNLCSDSNSINTTLAHLDLATPSTFDNQYYVNLMSGQGLLQSDQILMAGDELTRQLVETYAYDPEAFFEDFVISMLRMGRIGGGNDNNNIGQVRTNCRVVNYPF